MRIVSPFHDYYDAALAYGADPALVYVRRPVTYGAAPSGAGPSAGAAPPGLSPPTPEAREARAIVEGLWAPAERWALSGLYTLRLNRARPPGQFGDTGVVGFCGRLHPFAEVYRNEQGELARGWEALRTVFAYRPDDPALQQALAGKLDEGPPMNNDVRRRVEKDLRDGVARFFEPRESPEPFRLLGAPAFVLREDRLEVNPPLGAVGFGKVTDAFSAFQALSLFLPTVLAPRDAPEPQVTDDQVLAQSKGFDTKTSFRRDKGGRRKREDR